MNYGYKVTTGGRELLAALLATGKELEGIQAVAVNTLGVLYVVEQGDTVHSMADLKGRTILSTGKGTTPELSLIHISAAKRLVAPNGGSAARDLSCFAPDDHVVRVTFNGASTAKPLVASLAAEKGILVSVLSLSLIHIFVHNNP